MQHQGTRRGILVAAAMWAMVGVATVAAPSAGAADGTSWQPPASVGTTGSVIHVEDVAPGDPAVPRLRLTQATSAFEVRWDDGRLVVVGDGDDDLTINLTRPGAGRLTAGLLLDHIPDWSGAYREVGGFSVTPDCNRHDAWVRVDAVRWSGDAITNLTMRWRLDCGDGAAQYGYLRWDAADPTRPPSPRPIPTDLWKPPSGTMPATGSALYVTGQASHPLLRGDTIKLTDANATIDWGLTSSLEHPDDWSIGTSVDEWSVRVIGMRGRGLQVGYYPDVLQGGANPVRGGFTLSGRNQRCATATGWMAIDEVRSTNGIVDRIRARFGQRCNGTSTANVAIQVNLSGGTTPALRAPGVTDREGQPGERRTQVTAMLNRAAPFPVTIGWKTVDGTAKAGSDYVAAQGTMAIPRGELSAMADVTILGDTVHEGTETFQIAFGPVTGATAPAGATTITITDDDPAGGPPPPVATPRGTTVAEGNPDRMAFVTLTLDRPATTTTQVRWTIKPGTATSPADFEAGGGVVPIPAGATSTSVGVWLVDDAVREATETLTVVFSEPNGITLASTTATVTITDDDAGAPPPTTAPPTTAPPTTTPSTTAPPGAAPTLSIGSRTVVEGPSKRVEQLTVTLSRAASAPITFTWNTSAGTATSPGDYLGARATVTIPAGATRVDLPVTVVGDAKAEPTERFTVVLSSPKGAGLATAVATVTVADDD